MDDCFDINRGYLCLAIDTVNMHHTHLGETPTPGIGFLQLSVRTAGGLPNQTQLRCNRYVDLNRGK